MRGSWLSPSFDLLNQAGVVGFLTSHAAIVEIHRPQPDREVDDPSVLIDAARRMSPAMIVPLATTSRAGTARRGGRAREGRETLGRTACRHNDRAPSLLR